MTRTQKTQGTAAFRVCHVDVAGRPVVILSFPATKEERLPLCLTKAELEVAAMLIGGSTNAAIAAKRRTSVSTVTNQVAAIYRKCGVGSRAELAAFTGAAGIDEKKDKDGETRLRRHR